MTSFAFVLKDNNQKAYQSFWGFLFFLHIAAVCLVLLHSNNSNTITYNLGFLIIYILVAFLYFFRNKKYIHINHFLLMGIIYIIFWVIHHNYVAAGMLVFIIIIANVLRVKKSTVVFSDEHIIIKSILSVKKYTWSDIDHVILKDGLLTVDFKSNKIFQVEIIEESDNVVKSFNDFALSKLISKQD